MKKTKIIFTVGPASESEETLQKLFEAGANVVRFNFSHANYENAKKVKLRIDELNASGKTSFSTLLDTKGPEIRTGDVAEKINIKKGDKIRLFVDQNKMSAPTDIFCDYEYLVDDLELDDVIEIDSGLLKTIVTSKTKDHLEVEAQSDAVIGSRRHINLPGKQIKLPGVTSKDKEDVLFAIENGYDFIAQSFVRTGENVQELRQILDENNASHIKIIAKIENEEGIQNLDDIVKVADGIMVARGDLGIETPIEMLPIFQRQMVKKCLESGKFVIIATQLLETMMESPFPTRAEVSDVFNSVMQKTDCMMLSGETAMGKYPVETVRTMSNVINEAEKQMTYKHQDFSNNGLNARDIEKKMLIRSAIFMSEDLDVDAILVFTKTGRLARLTAGFRPTKQVFTFTGESKTLRFINILFGIRPILLKNWDSRHLFNLENGIKHLVETGALEKNSKVIAITDIEKNEKEIPVLEIISIADFF